MRGTRRPERLASSGRSAERRVVDGPLLDERLLPLVRLIRGEEQLQCVEREGPYRSLDSVSTLNECLSTLSAVGSSRAARRPTRAPCAEAVRWDDDPPSSRARFSPMMRARYAVPTRRRTSPPSADLAEPGGLDGDRDVAEDVQHVRSLAWDRSDDVMQVLDLEHPGLRRPVITALGHLLLIATLQNARSPAPVKATTPTAGSAHAAPKQAMSSSTVCARNALYRSTLLIVIHASPSSTSYTTSTSSRTERLLPPRRVGLS